MTRIENMKGGNGADTIRGDSGKNVLAGGPGNDRFIFGDGAGTDTVLDFVGGAEATDRLDLSDNTFLDSFADVLANARQRSEEHTSELPSLMRISYAVFCL